MRVLDRLGSHFWIDPCHFFPDLISKKGWRDEKLGPAGRILAGNLAGIWQKADLMVQHASSLQAGNGGFNRFAHSAGTGLD